MIVNQYKKVFGGHVNNNVSNSFKSTCPVLLKEIPDSRTRAGNIQAKPERSYIAIK